MSIDQRIRDGLHATNDQLPAPDIDRALATVTAGGRRTHRRNLLVALAAAAAAVLVIVGMLAVTRDWSDSTEPVGPSTPTVRTTDTIYPADPMVNGRIQSPDEYVGRVGAACDRCYWPGSAFDQDTGTLLLIESKADNGTGIAGIRLVGRDGQAASLTCANDFACPKGLYAATLGPGADEFSLLTDGNQVRVLGFDGTMRRRIDLSAALDEDDNAFVAALAWSPDGNRLAVLTGGFGYRGIWLLDRNGTEPQLAYTASSTERFPRLAVTWLAWSPDGSRLGFIEEHWNLAAEFGRPESEIDELTTAVSLSVPDAEQGAPGAATTLYEYPKPHPQYNDDAPSLFLWSPDGARVAVRFYDRFLELAADDGRVLAEHPFVEGDLIWPARRP